MEWSEAKKSRLLSEFFVLAFFTSLLVIWYTMIVAKDYVVFLDEETVPAPTDFFVRLLGASEEAERE